MAGMKTIISRIKHVVLGLIFLKYISDAFEEMRIRLMDGQGEYEGANPEDPDEYRAKFQRPEVKWKRVVRGFREVVEVVGDETGQRG